MSFMGKTNTLTGRKKYTEIKKNNLDHLKYTFETRLQLFSFFADKEVRCQASRKDHKRKTPGLVTLHLTLHNKSVKSY